MGAFGLAMAVVASPALAESWPAVKDAEFTRFFRQTNGWEAGDVATSVPLDDGRVLWLFGDSYIDQLDARTGSLPCLFDARNAVMVRSPNDPWTPLTLTPPAANGRTFFRPPDAPPGQPWPCFWPGAGFQLGDRVYISLIEMRRTPAGGMWGFEPAAQYWAELSLPQLTVARYVKLPNFNGILFWCGFVRDEANGCIYAFGNKRVGRESDVYTARFPIHDPAAPWQFWDGGAWSANPTNAAPVMRATSTSVNACAVNHRIVLVSTEFSVACDQGSAIYVYGAARPMGPFTAPKTIFRVDDRVEGHLPFFYGAVPHPESVGAGKGLLITYCLNGYEPCVPNCVDGKYNPDYYRPRAIRLPLEALPEPPGEP